MAGPELTNPRAARVKAVRRLAKRAFRVQERRFLAEGPQAVREALAAPGVVIEVFVTADAESRWRDLVEQARAAGADVQTVSGEVMAALAQTVTPQGVLAVCRFCDVPLTEVTAAGPALVVVLCDVRDPGNAGTVLRAADAAGADAVVFAGGSVDAYNPKCVRASAGSLFHLPVCLGVEVADVVDALRAGGLAVLAADSSGEHDLDAVLEAGGLAGRTGWLFGNEAWGLRGPQASRGHRESAGDLRSLADAVVRVPIHGRAESLNLATAATVCLYSSARAQRGVGGCRQVSSRR